MPERVARHLGQRIVRRVSLAELCGDDERGGLATWRDCIACLMGAEVVSCLGAWIDAVQPQLGPMPTAGFEVR